MLSAPKRMDPDQRTIVQDLALDLARVELAPTSLEAIATTLSTVQERKDLEVGQRGSLKSLGQ